MLSLSRENEIIPLNDVNHVTKMLSIRAAEKLQMADFILKAMNNKLLDFIIKALEPNLWLVNSRDYN